MEINKLTMMLPRQAHKTFIVEGGGGYHKQEFKALLECRKPSLFTVNVSSI